VVPAAICLNMTASSQSVQWAAIDPEKVMPFAGRLPRKGRHQVAG
jgi:hypothetical protein